MAEKIRIHKTVQEKDALEKVIRKEFTTFIDSTAAENIDTVDELFRMYTKLYLEIPLQGAKSHTTLIEDSSKLVEIEQDNEDIQPLLDEITNLRENLLS